MQPVATFHILDGGVGAGTSRILLLVFELSPVLSPGLGAGVGKGSFTGADALSLSIYEMGISLVSTQPKSTCDMSNHTTYAK